MNNHGGKRKGAGRKPLSTPKKTITVKLDPDMIDRINVICRSRGVSQACLIAAWVNDTK